MSEQKHTPSSTYQSCLAPWFKRFIQEKRDLGFSYTTAASLLLQFDRLLQEEKMKREELPRTTIERWLTPQPYHAPQTLTRRRSMARQLALFLIRNNISAYIPPFKGGQIVRYNYSPYIFSRKDIKKLLTAADSLPCNGHAPLRPLIIPEVFRLLYGCGLRINEVMRLQVKDVDLAGGILTIREAKGNQDRLVPLASSMKDRLDRYAKGLGNRSPNTPFFPAPHGGFYYCGRMYANFRQLLWQAGISHGGRGKGPRLHDIRHTMVVHRLIKWYREGADLYAKLPILATYLGHKHLDGTQRYLHLSAEIFPDLTSNVESAFGHIIPERSAP